MLKMRPSEKMKRRASRLSARGSSLLGASMLGLCAAVASRGSIFIANIAFAHSLTVHDFGVFSYAYTTALNLGLFLATGITQAAGLVLPRIESVEDRGHQLRAFLSLSIAVASIAASALFLSSGSLSSVAFSSAAATAPLRAASFLLVVTALAQASQGFLYALGEHRLVALNSMATGIILLVSVFFIPKVGKPEMAIFIILTVNSISAIFQLGFLMKLFGAVARRRKGGEMRVAVKTSLPAILTTSLGAPVHWACLSLLVATDDGTKQLALFSIAFQCYAIITFIPAALGSIALPFLSRSGINSASEKRSQFRLTLLVSGSVALLIGGVAAIFASNIVEHLYPTTYGGAVLPLRVLSVAATLCGFSVIIQQRILADGRIWLNFCMVAVYSTVYIIGSYIGLRAGLGAIAPGLAMILGYVILILLQIVAISRKSAGREVLLAT